MILNILLAFIAGVAGTFIGGTGTFVLTGLGGIAVAILNQGLGIDTPVFNTYFMNLILVPCIIFNGAGAATAYLGKKRDDIKGYETGRPLGFAKDYTAMLIAGVTAVLGYLAYTFLNNIGAPVDTGAVVVIAVGILGRIIWGDSKFINKDASNELSPNAVIRMTLFQVVFAIVIGLLTILLVDTTGIVSIGFSISALTLLIGFKYPSFPATHQITMVTGYAWMATHNIIISLVFAVIAQIIFTFFAMYCNNDCNTHIDPPAVAIMICSFVIMTVF